MSPGARSEQTEVTDRVCIMVCHVRDEALRGIRGHNLPLQPMVIGPEANDLCTDLELIEIKNKAIQMYWLHRLAGVDSIAGLYCLIVMALPAGAFAGQSTSWTRQSYLPGISTEFSLDR